MEASGKGKKTMNKSNKKKRYSKLAGIAFSGILMLFVTALISLLLRLFVVASYHVSTSSMEPTIMPGDFILVNQLVLGARYFKEETNKNGEKVFSAKRIPGFRKVRRNDILVFNYPHLESMDIDVSEDCIKRCVAIPRDTFLIYNGLYRVKGLSDTLGYVNYQLRLSALNCSFMSWGVYHTYPKDSLHHWTIKDLGPYYIPGKGDTIKLSVQNIGLYREAIVYETKQSVQIRFGKIWLGEKPIAWYVFRHDYYFMAGDNVFDSGDSRYWGLLPDDHIIGKASMIWKSKDLKTNKFNYKRFFRSI